MLETGKRHIHVKWVMNSTGRYYHQQIIFPVATKNLTKIAWAKLSMLFVYDVIIMVTLLSSCIW